MNRSLYPGQDRTKRWVGLGVIAENLISMGGLMPPRAHSELDMRESDTQGPV